MECLKTKEKWTIEAFFFSLVLHSLRNPRQTNIYQPRRPHIPSLQADNPYVYTCTFQISRYAPFSSDFRPCFSSLSRSTRSCTTPTKSEAKERLHAVYTFVCTKSTKATCLLLIELPINSSYAFPCNFLFETQFWIFICVCRQLGAEQQLAI